jgi:PLP dependent protein
MRISQNLAAIHERIARAAERAGRKPSDIALMAVTKTHPAERIIEAYEAGHRLFGENRVQEFAEKYEALRGLDGAEFHMIGHLQSNKAGKAVEIFHAIDSLDSVKLGDRLNAAAEKIGKTVDVLIEINIGGEDAKSGIDPDSPELEGILMAAGAQEPGAPSLGQAQGGLSSPSVGERAGSKWQYLRIRGLMTVPPYTEDPEGARPYLRRLRELRDRIAARNLPGVSLAQLSMGMSHDFEVAIEEGSTCVRVGTAIFGEREQT